MSFSQTDQDAAVVTGGSSGIGYAVAREFVTRGHPVLLVARDGGRLAAAKARLAAEAPASAIHTCPLDVRDAEAVGRHLPEAIRKFDRLPGYLVNSAGIYRDGALATMPAEDLSGLLASHAAGTHAVTAAVLPEFLVRGRGAILNVGSLAGLVPTPGYAGYGATKAYVASITTALRLELAGRGITVSLLAPGPVRTPFTEHGGSGRTRLETWLATSPEIVAEAAYLGMRSGEAVIVPSLRARLIHLAGRAVPGRLGALAVLIAGHVRAKLIGRREAA